MKANPKNIPEQDTALAETRRNPLVRAKVVGKRLDLHERTVLLHAQEGLIPCYRIGKSVRFDLDAVWAAIEGRQP